MSRGAASATLVEAQSGACMALRDNVRKLGATAEVVQSDAMRFLAGAATPYDMVFLDPPFGEGLALDCCRLLEERGWLSPGAMVYVEAERTLVLDGLPDCWQLWRSKTAGAVGYHLFQRRPAEGGSSGSATT